MRKGTYSTELRYDHGDDSPHHMIDYTNEDGDHTLIGEACDAEMAHFLVAAANEQGTSGIDRVTTFHEAFGLPVNAPGYVPTVEERLLRGRLLLEEVLEHLITGLGLTLVWQDDTEPNDEFFMGAAELKDGSVKLLLSHEGGEYNPVETLDGLCDVKVIANGTGVAFGLPVKQADKLVFDANMAKLGEDGKPIINGVTPGYRTAKACGEETVIAWRSDFKGERGYRDDLPIGKVLKPAGWQPADIAGLLK